MFRREPPSSYASWSDWSEEEEAYLRAWSDWSEAEEAYLKGENDVESIDAEWQRDKTELIIEREQLALEELDKACATTVALAQQLSEQSHALRLSVESLTQISLLPEPSLASSDIQETLTHSFNN